MTITGRTTVDVPIASEGVEVPEASPDRSQPARRAKTRLRILGAAQMLFAGQGYAETTIDHITAEAGVGRATFYLHFAGKSEVLRAIFDRFKDALRGVMRKMATNVTGGEDAIFGWIETYIAFLIAERHSVQALAVALNAGGGAYLEREEWHKLVLDTFGEQIHAFRIAADRIDPTITAKAQLLLFQFEGFTTACALGHWHADTEVTARQLARSILAFINDEGRIAGRARRHALPKR